MNTQSLYQTTDLALAGVLALSIPLEGVDKTNPGKSLFLFKRSEGLDSLVEAYWKRQLTIEPQAYFQSLKVIKNRLYATE